MRISTFLLTGLLLAGLAASAQSPAPPAATVLFANYWWDAVPQAQAAYRIQRREAPGQSRLDSVFYLVPNRLLRVSNTRWLPNGDTLVTTTTWRAGGQLFSIDNALGYRPHGEYRAYDAAGHLKLTAQYDRGRQLGAQCFTPDGGPRPCTSTEYTEKNPVFPADAKDAAGTGERVNKYLLDHVRFLAAKRPKGLISINFIIAETGLVRDVWVGGVSLSKVQEETVISAMMKMPRWLPTEKDGEPVPVQYHARYTVY